MQGSSYMKWYMCLLLIFKNGLIFTYLGYQALAHLLNKIKVFLEKVSRWCTSTLFSETNITCLDDDAHGQKSKWVFYIRTRSVWPTSRNSYAYFSVLFSAFYLLYFGFFPPFILNLQVSLSVWTRSPAIISKTAHTNFNDRSRQLVWDEIPWFFWGEKLSMNPS